MSNRRESHLPPYEVQTVFLANELKDRLDWGQAGLPDALARATGAGIRVAVLDTGVDRIHANEGDLFDAILAGRNFTPYGDSDEFWDDHQDGHGTHCAGIVGARQDKGPIIGFAPECELLIGKVLHRGTGQNRWIAAAIYWAVAQGAHVISASFGSPYPDPEIAAAIEYAVSRGVFVICAAGNTGRDYDVNFPARYHQPVGHPNLDTIAVAAYGEDGQPAPYSSRGPEVDIAGPGTNVTSLWLNGGHATISGTSMACPMVAGCTALLLDRHKRLGGGITPLRTMDELRKHLDDGAIDIVDPNDGRAVGRGLLKVDKLLASVVPPEAPDGGAADPGDVALLLELGPIKIYSPAGQFDLAFNF
jgi:subtilisin family serine protease